MPESFDGVSLALGDRYAVERELGRGGMATVYLATDRKHRRSVAVKVLNPDLAASLGVQRFLREIEVAAGLTHPHILPVHDSGEAGGLLYFVMPHLEGGSLRDRLKREPQLPLDDALRITHEVAGALSYAHERGIVHRDIKPENILFQQGQAVVADFGIAKAISEASTDLLTKTGTVIGTPAYMSPEQALDAAVIDGRSDLYSLGCVLYEMLAGEPPFTGVRVQAVVARKLAEPIPRLSVVRESVPASVEAAVNRALARSPADRFADAAELVTAISATNVAPSDTSRRPVSSSKRRLVTIALVLLVVAAAIGGLILRRPAAAPALDMNLIAVLPFSVASGDSAVHPLSEQMLDLFWMKLTGLQLTESLQPRSTLPGTVLPLWSQAGGTSGASVSETDALRIAGKVGAGNVVVGSIAGTAQRLEVSASLLALPDGERRAHTSAEGSLDSLPDLVDRLIVMLMSQSMGEPARRLPSLATYPPEAVGAYLSGVAASRRGLDAWPEAITLFDEALRVDSTFALAALASYALGERDTTAARIAWVNRSHLSTRDQTYLDAMVGWRFGFAPTVREQIALWQRAVLGAPDAADAWKELANDLAMAGPEAGVPDWQDRFWQAVDRASPIVGLDSWWFQTQLLSLATADGDSARIRRFERDMLLPDSVRATNPRTRWTLALMLQDSIAAAEAEPGVLSAPTATPAIAALAVGRWLDGADRIMRAADTDVRSETQYHVESSTTYWRSRGRYDLWDQHRRKLYAALPPAVAATRRVRDALYLGAPQDSAVDDAVQYLSRVIEGRITPAPTSEIVALSHCWLAQWRITQRDRTGVSQAIRFMRSALTDTSGFVVCPALLEALLARLDGRQFRDLVLRLDSIVAPMPRAIGSVFWPEPEEYAWHDNTARIDNLLLSRLLVESGDTAAALKAARRRPWDMRMIAWTDGIYVDFLMEEGRIAALLGDTASAVEAYRHYLAVRDNPDYGPWQIERDEVSRALAELAREGRSRRD